MFQKKNQQQFNVTALYRACDYDMHEIVKELLEYVRMPINALNEKTGVFLFFFCFFFFF